MMKTSSLLPLVKNPIVYTLLAVLFFIVAIAIDHKIFNPSVDIYYHQEETKTIIAGYFAKLFVVCAIAAIYFAIVTKKTR